MSPTMDGDTDLATGTGRTDARHFESRDPSEALQVTVFPKKFSHCFSGVSNKIYSG